MVSLSVDVALDSKEIVDKIHNEIQAGSVNSLRKYLIENENEFQGDYHNLMKQYLNYVYDSKLADDKKREYILILSDYMYKDVFVLDKEINAFACWNALSKI